MKRPNSPKNYEFWRHILEQADLFAKFMKEGNGRQKRELDQARKVYKWEKIQARKGSK